MEGPYDPVIYAGTRFSIEWAMNARGRYPAMQIFMGLPDREQAAFLKQFELFANSGQFASDERFKKVEKGLFEFKRFRIRFFGDFRGARFLIAHGVTDKKTDRLRPADIEKARRILRENDEIERKGASR